MIQISDIENIIGTKINSPTLYQRAFTHKSAHEESYENLEFIGDSVLSFIVTKYLYDKYSHEHQEGFLTKARTKLVRGTTLALISEKMGLAQWIQMDEKGLRNEWNKNPKILEDVLEALIGAIYLDLGILHAKQFIFNMLIEHPVDLDLDDNYKDQLMRLCQSNKKPLPIYKVESFTCNIYSIHVIVDDIVVGKGTGGNKKVAEQEAAKEALKIYTF